VAAMAFLAGLAGLDPALLAYLSPLPTEALLQAAATSPDLTSLTVGGSRRLLHRQHAETIAERIIELLRTFHEANPRQPGMAREELKSRLPAWFDREVSAAMADRMVAQGVLKGDELTMACADFEVHFDQRFAALVERAEALLRAGGMTPPLRDELRQTLACDDRELTEVVTTMQSQSRAVKISADVILHADAEEEARKKLVAFLQERGTISTQELKELWGVSRKYLIPLAEYYDASRLTARVGESQRKLRRG